MTVGIDSKMAKRSTVFQSVVPPILPLTHHYHISQIAMLFCHPLKSQLFRNLLVDLITRQTHLQVLVCAISPGVVVRWTSISLLTAGKVIASVTMMTTWIIDRFTSIPCVKTFAKFTEFMRQ
jgi:hypothetical protein